MQTANDPISVLNLAIEREEGGHRFYKETAQKVSDGKGKQMFQWLAKEELGHLNRLEAERENYLKCGEWLKQAEAEIRAVSEPLERSQFPSPPEAAGEVKPTVTELDALKIAMEAEKQSIELYSSAAKLATGRQAKSLFQKLVKVEQGHLDLLSDEYDWLRKSGSYFTIHRFSISGR